MKGLSIDVSVGLKWMTAIKLVVKKRKG